MCWSSKIGEDRSKNVKMYVEVYSRPNQGVARGARNVLFVLYKLMKPFFHCFRTNKLTNCCEIFAR